MRLAVVILAFTAAASADVSDRISRILPLPPDAAVSVHVTVGDVVVNGWDRSDMSVEIVRRAADAAGLARIPAHVEQTPAGVVVRALQPDDGREPGLRTDVVLRVPSGARIQGVSVFEGRVDLSELRGACSARVERGDIHAKRLSGEIRLETAIGHIRVDDALLSPDGVIRLRTFNGNVTLGLARVPPDARILALSMGGTVTSDIPLNLKERWGPRFGEATLGRGEPVISIDAVNGDVAIRVAGAGR